MGISEHPEFVTRMTRINYLVEIFLMELFSGTYMFRHSFRQHIDPSFISTFDSNTTSYSYPTFSSLRRVRYWFL